MNSAKKLLHLLRTEIHKRIRPGKPRQKYREVPRWVIEAFIKVYNKEPVRTLQSAIFSLLSGDPWGFLNLLGIPNWWPIEHEPSTDFPIEVSDLEKLDPRWTELLGGFARTDVVGYRISTGGFHYCQVKKVRDPNVPPLGPEDYELGLQVPPSNEPDYRLMTTLDLGNFQNLPKLYGAFIGIRYKLSEPYQPGMDALEAAIKELESKK